MIVGGGVSGLTAALAAARAKCDVLLVDENPYFGGYLSDSSASINGKNISDWIRIVLDELKSYENVKLLKRTSAMGY